ncbi:hypothetical protein IQ288_31615 [Burkholderia sp. R-69980]|nr:hypothetical protein [Burkholderia sp. R-69980]
MRQLQGQDLLLAWERGTAPSRVPALHRALAMLEAACPEYSRDALAALTVTARDRMLLQLRELSFGPRLDCCFDCLQCGETLEFSASTYALLAAGEREMQASVEAGAAQVPFAGYRLTLREASTDDVEIAASAADDAAALRMLAERCVQVEDDEGQCVAAQAWSPALLDHAIGRLEQLHDALLMVLKFDCPACGCHDAQPFDAAAFVWNEVSHRAQQLLDDVHALAWTYGWSEAAILGMHARRRQAYLERAGL